MIAKLRAASLAAALAVPLVAGSARADGLETNYRNTVTVEPLDLLTGTFNLQYERAFSPIWSAYLGLNYLYITPLEAPDSGTQIAFGPELGLRLYLLGRAPAGLWFGPEISDAWVRNFWHGTEYDSVGFSLGGMVGLNIALGHFTGSIGVGSNFYDYSNMVGGTRIGFYGLELRERLAVGVVF